MAEQRRAETQRTDEQQMEHPLDVPAAQASAQRQAEVAQVDDLLDEIDAVLESNAEEFVRGFVQKGGQ